MVKRLPLFATLLLLATQSVYANSLLASSVSFTPDQLTEKGHFSGCGVTFQFTNDTGGQTINFALYSLSIWKNHSYALSSTQSASGTLGNELEWKTIESSWIRVRGKEPLNHLASKQGKKKSLLSPVSLGESLDFLKLATENETIQLGVTVGNDSREMVFYGVPKANLEAKTAFLECLKELHQKSPDFK